MTLAGLLLGLASALSWGAGDFAGGMASRATGMVAALLATQVIGLLAALALLAITNEAAPPPAALAWAVVAGVTGVLGLAAFFRALAVGSMSLVAPLVAVTGAGLPVGFGVLTGERLDPLQVIGVAFALGAVGLVSRPSGRHAGESPPARAGLPLVLLAGIGFAGFFIFLDRAQALGGQTWWPILAARSGGLLVPIALLAAHREARRPQRRILPLLVVASLGDLGGNTFFVLANGVTGLGVATVLSSLYPVTTAVLAWLILHERLAQVHLAGVGLAVLGIVLIAM